MLIDELYRNKRQRVETKNWKNITSQLRQRKFMLRQFLAGCQNKEEIVTTKKLLSLQMKQEEGRNSVATKYLLSRQEIKEQYKKNTTTDKLRCNIMKNIRQNLYRDRILFCRDTDYCNMEKLVEIEEELRRKISIATR